MLALCPAFNGITFAVDPRYVIRSYVGQGAQGVIWSAVDSHDPNRAEVAVKKVPNALDEVLASKRLLRELRVLRHLKHENIISLKDIMLPPSTNVLLWKDVYMVYELMDTDLDYVIKSGQEISEEHVRYFSSQILMGIAYLVRSLLPCPCGQHPIPMPTCRFRARSVDPTCCLTHTVSPARLSLRPGRLPHRKCLQHRCNVVHRDLKPGNVLVDRDCHLKICDFGLARSCAKQSDSDSHQLMTMYVTTRWYRAPELLCLSPMYGPAVDMWSVGCIIAELFTRKPLFQGVDPLSQLEQVVRCVGQPSEEDLEAVMNEGALQFIEGLPQCEPRITEELVGATPLAVDLIRRLLTFAPEKRASAEVALAHEYVASHQPAANQEAKRLEAPALLSEWLTITGFSTLPTEQLQNLVFQEMLHFHPEATKLKWGAA